MTHPHRVSDQTNWHIAKCAALGLVEGTLSVGIPILVAWYFFGHLLPVAERPAPAPTIEAGIKI